TGKFFQDSSEEVYLHYGFGNSWENLTDVKMEKSDLGFQIEVDLLDSDSLCFCLKNGNNEWDNNDGQNYVFPIEHVETDLIVVPEESLGLTSPRKLRKSYILTKKIKIAIYKVLRFLPKLVSGNYKKKSESEN
ncbi:hypothetical protein IKQ19_10085, partial [Candidatus Saccharibacteria bacterium]|nr:hypothetical protein [Candidatus Saccharibacteria bacterium]